MSPLGSAPFRFFREFRCHSCNGQKAYRSRYRGILEQILLSFLILRPVRCDRCYHRSYVFRTVPVLEPGPDGKLDNQPSGNSRTGSRVA